MSRKPPSESRKPQNKSRLRTLYKVAASNDNSRHTRSSSFNDLDYFSKEETKPKPMTEDKNKDKDRKLKEYLKNIPTPNLKLLGFGSPSINNENKVVPLGGGKLRTKKRRYKKHNNRSKRRKSKVSKRNHIKKRNSTLRKY